MFKSRFKIYNVTYLKGLSFIFIAFFLGYLSCSIKNNSSQKGKEERTKVSAKDLLGNPKYLAISYGGYRKKTRDIQPTLAEIKEDMRILSAMGIKLIRTYNTHYPQAENILKAINELNQEDKDFEMYVMLGAWINCKDAFSPNPKHDLEDELSNEAEIKKAIELQKQYPEIVKIIAVGNEAMVHWATSYFVKPAVILKWVNHLQELKQNGILPKDLWITSSDNFASWGGGEIDYHHPDLEKLIKAVDFISLHTYPMHDTHYNPSFWGVDSSENDFNKLKKIEMAMIRATNYAIKQYEDTKKYIHQIDSTKTIHIGETGWASYSNGFYGNDGSNACDEYKEGLYYKMIRNWTNKVGLTCFYFEAFNEIWKDAANSGGSENHFGLFTINGQAKYALWNLVDNETFKGLSRNGNPIQKTYLGNIDSLLNDVQEPPTKKIILKK